jgi:hypothetical protein
MGAAAQWLFNFCIAEITPNAVSSIGWRTFIVFGVFCMAMGVWVFFSVKETKGKTLEDMDILFGAVDAQQRALDIEMMMNKADVGAEARIEDVTKEGVRQGSSD